VASALGDYLRARRRQVRPEDVGLVAGKRRRVAGLRREELATLAGISSAYYLRLEQGSATHPSGQVVDALAGPFGWTQDRRSICTTWPTRLQTIIPTPKYRPTR
jgi:DNA-binding XRE family transcriptional regulator